MARNLENQTNVVAPTSDYPSGRIKNDTGANDGTPVNESVYGDIHQFFMKMMREANREPNDLPDNVSNTFQLWEAFYDNSVRKPLEFSGIFETTKSSFTGLGINGIPITADKYHIYFIDDSSSNSPIIKREKSTGNETSITNLPGQSPTSLIVYDDLLWVTIPLTGVRVYDKNGNEQGAKAININQVIKGITVYDGIVYVGSQDNNEILRFNESNNNQLASMGSGLQFINSLASGYGQIFFCREGEHRINGISTDLSDTLNVIIGQENEDGGEAIFLSGGKLYTLVRNGVNRRIAVVDALRNMRLEGLELDTENQMTDIVISENKLYTGGPGTDIHSYDQVWLR